MNVICHEDISMNLTSMLTGGIHQVFLNKILSPVLLHQLTDDYARVESHAAVNLEELNMDDASIYYLVCLN